MKKNLFLLLIFSAFHVSALSQAQTKTANLFNWNGNPYQNLWQREGPQYVAADDNSYAYSKKLSSGRSFLSLTLQDFRFEIPSGATINNITVTVRRFKNGKASIRDYFANLLTTGSGFYNPFPYGVRWTDPTPYPNAETAVSYAQSGSGTNVGLDANQTYEWTPQLINDATFGVRIDTYEPVGGSLVVYYDLVTITVAYTEQVTSRITSRKSPEATEIKTFKQPIVYPNPFTTKTNIQFTAAESGKAVVELYNILGAKTQTLFSKDVVQGQQYNVLAGEAQLPKGIYIYTISNGKQKFTSRIVKAQ
jgi:hypothetical protein